jgi:hypothetical protein
MGVHLVSFTPGGLTSGWSDDYFVDAFDKSLENFTRFRISDRDRLTGVSGRFSPTGQNQVSRPKLNLDADKVATVDFIRPDQIVRAYFSTYGYRSRRHHTGDLIDRQGFRRSRRKAFRQLQPHLTVPDGDSVS